MALAVKERSQATRRDTAARSRLADAIAALGRAEAAHTAAQDAVEAAEAAHAPLSRESYDAEVALKRLGRAGMPQQRADAEAALTAADAAAAASFTDLQRVKEAAEKPASELVYARRRVHAEANAVISAEAAPAAAALAAEIIEIQQELAERLAVLIWLARRDVPLAERDKPALVLRGFLAEMAPCGVPRATAWDLALEVLQRDADGPLPG